MKAALMKAALMKAVLMKAVLMTHTQTRRPLAHRPIVTMAYARAVPLIDASDVERSAGRERASDQLSDSAKGGATAHLGSAGDAEWGDDSLQLVASTGTDMATGGEATDAARARTATAHLYLGCMALVILHHLPKVREGCARCGVGMGALELFGEAVAMPAFATLAGTRDRALSPAALRRAALETSVLLGGALLVVYSASLSERVWWFYRYMIFPVNKGSLKAPSREYFHMHLVGRTLQL